MRPPTLSIGLLLLVLALSACNSIPPILSPLPGGAPNAAQPAVKVFVPLLVDNPVTPNPQPAPNAQPTFEPVPFTHLGEGEREVIPRIVEVAGKLMQLPDDIYVEGTMVTAEPVPGARRVPVPLAILHRGPYVALVSIREGDIIIVATTAKERAEAIAAFDFLIQALGEEKLWPPDEVCADCVIPESPLPTPTAAPEN